METTGPTVDNEGAPLQASRVASESAPLQASKVANEINDRNMSLNACINQIAGSMQTQSNMVGRVTVVVAATRPCHIAPFWKQWGGWAGFPRIE